MLSFLRTSMCPNLTSLLDLSVFMNTLKTHYFKYMVRNTLKQFSNMMVEAKRIERLIKKRKIQDVKIPSTFTEEKETDMNLHVNIIHKHGSQPWLHHLNFSTKPFSIP